VAADELASGAVTAAGTELASDTAGAGINLTSGAITVNLTTGGGIQFLGSGLTLNRSCSAGQIMKWSTSGWYCATDTLQVITDNGATTTGAVTIDSDSNEQTSIGGNLTVHSGVLFVSKDTDNVGIGTINPYAKLEVNGGVRLNTTTSKPTCDSSQRGTMWYEQSGSGTDDYLYVCMKNAANTYNWVLVARGS
jgi:hypothetical protein